MRKVRAKMRLWRKIFRKVFLGDARRTRKEHLSRWGVCQECSELRKEGGLND